MGTRKKHQCIDGIECKHCYRCKVYKPLTEFHKSKWSWDQLNNICKACSLTSVKNYNKENSDTRKNYKLKASFGITLDDYNQLLEEQDGLCKICRKEERTMRPCDGKPRRLAVDHDHNTRKVRGLLCSFCNVILGLCGENKEVLNSCIDYLEANK